MIEIDNWFSEEATGAGFIRLRAHANAEEPFEGATNPFAEQQIFDVYEINVLFYAEGSNKRIAECQYSFDPGEVTFHSNPME